MGSSRSRGDDDLAVLISLAIAVGMLIGAVAAMWLWGAMSESMEAVMSLHANEMPEIIEELRQAK
jgi:type III secretory pathway component EscT